MDPLDLDANFQPLSRARSNTWPLPRPEYYTDKECDEKLVVVPATIQESSGDAGSQLQPKKNSSRRNAWGNKSYADLITQAIQSAQDRRLTLSQIYDWMVQNVAYFKDKGDSNSSAGWKNSIRHNLSLHNRFMRVQNEGTGKSSWWMVNPDAKPGKAARRRATSMETAKYEKKRTKAKEAKAKALRQQQQNQQQMGAHGVVTPSPSSSVSEGLDMFPESPHTTFQLSPETFRPRASSNASSCGRLSPIPAADADVLQDSSSQTLPPLSPIPWTTYSSTSLVDRYVSDQLVDSLTVAMKLGSTDNSYLENSNPSPSPPDHPPPTSTTPPQVLIKNEYQASANVQIKSEFPQLPTLMNSDYSSVSGGVRIKTEYQPPPSIQIKSEYPQPNVRIKSEYVLFDSPPPYVDRHQQDFGYQSQPSSPSAGGTLMPSPGQPCKSPQQDPYQPSAKMVTSAEAYRYLLAQHQQQQQQVLQQHQQSQQEERTVPKDVHPVLNNSAHLMMGHLSFNNSLPYDLDLNTLQGGLECDVDQVISHELSVDGELDFNFDPVAAAAAVAHANSINSRPWVH